MDMARKKKKEKSAKEKKEEKEREKSEQVQEIGKIKEKEEIELDEESLESLTEAKEPEEFEDFSDFMSSSLGRGAIEMPNPTLQTSTVAGTGDEPIEDSLANLPSSTPRTATTGREENVVYNMPDYVAGYEGMQEQDMHRDIEINITPQQLREEAFDGIRKINLNQWQREMIDMQPRRQREVGEEYQVRIGKEKKEEGLPFEDKKKYKEKF